MIRFHIWFLVVALCGGPLAAGFFLGFDAVEGEARRAAEGSVREDALRGEARVLGLAEEGLREAASVAQKAALHEELLPIAAGTGNPLAARDRIKASLDRVAAPGEVLVVADARGAVLFRARDARDDFRLPALADALRGLARSQVVVYGDGAYQVAVTPVLAGAQIVGAFAMGRRAAVEWVEKLRGDRNSAVAVVTNGKVTGANLAPRERADLQKVLGQLQPGKVRAVTLGDQTFLASLWRPPGAATVGVVHLRPERFSMMPLEELRLTYLYVAGAAFLVAIFWGLLLQRSIWRPASALVERVKAAADRPDLTVPSADLPRPWSNVALAAANAFARIRARIADVAAARAEAAVAKAEAAAVVAEARAEVEAARGTRPPEEAVPTLETPMAAAPETPGIAEAPPSTTLPGFAPSPVSGSATTLPEVASVARPVEAPPAAPPLPPREEEPVEELTEIAPPEPPPPARAPLFKDERTVIAQPPSELVRASADPLEEALPVLHAEFLMARRQAGESTDEVTFERFARKVRRVRDEIRAEHRCNEVLFEVYVRRGRAALRAHPRWDSERPSV